MGLHEEFQQLLVSRFSGEDTALILDMFRIASKDYSFSKAETAISTEVGDDSEELIKQFVVAKVIEGLSKRSIDYYKGRLLFFGNRVQVPLRYVTSEHIKAYVAQRKVIDKLEATTQNNEIRVLRSFFGWAYDNDYISKNPTLKIKSVREEKKVKKPFTEIELEQLRKAAANSKNSCKNVAIVEVFSSTGCRVSELCDLWFTPMYFSDVWEGRRLARRLDMLLSKTANQVQINDIAEPSTDDYIPEEWLQYHQKGGLNV